LLYLYLSSPFFSLCVFLTLFKIAFCPITSGREPIYILMKEKNNNESTRKIYE
jgi:hypothetical protein